MFVTVQIRPVIWKAVFLAVLFCSVSFARAEYLIFAGTTGAVGEKPISRVTVTDNRLALTFDVTWGEMELAKILTILEQQQVKATFFTGGSFMIANPERVKMIAAKGHEVGTLGQRILNLSTLPEQEIRSNLLGAQSLMEKATGSAARYFRPPQGPATEPVMAAARDAGMQTITFSLDGGDTYGMNPDQIVKRVLRDARKGDIIRLSASDFSPATAKALPQILRGLKAKGIQLVTLSELLPAAAPAPLPGQPGS